MEENERERRMSWKTDNRNIGRNNLVCRKKHSFFLGSIFVLLVKFPLSCEFPSFSRVKPINFRPFESSVAGQDTVMRLYLRNAEEVEKWSQLIQAVTGGGF